MRVALFGGSFNPPHVAHQLVALYVLETQPVDELWMIPCFQHPFEKSLEPFADRLEMCRRAADALGGRVRVSEVEGELGGESRTLRTVQALQAAHPGHEFSLIIGSDLQAETASWYGAEQLRRLVPFMVVGRGGHAPGKAKEAAEQATKQATVTAVTMPEISSSDVRRRLREGLPVDQLVPRTVLDYIQARGLYGKVEEP
jgi:nicotinate-nucleotide adenylyltransferase